MVFGRLFHSFGADYTEGSLTRDFLGARNLKEDVVVGSYFQTRVTVKWRESMEGFKNMSSFVDDMI